MGFGFSQLFPGFRLLVLVSLLCLGWPNARAYVPRLAYDAAWNLNYRTNNALIQTFTTESRNRLTNVTRSGTFTVSGTTEAPVTNVTVNGSNAAR